MQALWTSVNAALNTITTTCGALEKVAIIGDNFAKVGVIKSETYLAEAKEDQAVAHDEYAYNRALRKAKLDAKLAALTTAPVAQLAAP